MIYVYFVSMILMLVTVPFVNYLEWKNGDDVSLADLVLSLFWIFCPIANSIGFLVICGEFIFSLNWNVVVIKGKK